MSHARLAVALCHHPVLDPEGNVVTSAITNLDLHDLARCAATYDVAAAYAVTPIAKQRELAETVVHHWTDGDGHNRCPERSQAFARLRPAGSIAEVIALEAMASEQEPLIVVTSARASADTVTFPTLRQRLAAEPAVILFGTSRGLAPEAMALADLRLEPIVGPSPYNHLSVRSAMAIVIDRLCAVAATPVTPS